jgi:hypothetical protein
LTACSQKFAKVGGSLGKRARGGDADNVESLALAVVDDKCFRLGRVGDQKSRSA